MLLLLRSNAEAIFDPFATGNYTENNNWLYHSGELDHRGHYPYDVFFIQPTLYILSIRETTGLVQIPFYIQGLSFPLNLSPNTLLFDYYKDETRLIITLYLLDILIIIVYNKAGYFAY